MQRFMNLTVTFLVTFVLVFGSIALVIPEKASSQINKPALDTTFISKEQHILKLQKQVSLPDIEKKAHLYRLVYSTIAEHPNQNIQVVFDDLKTHRSILNIDGDKPIYSASLIKLIILIESLREKNTGELDFNQVVPVNFMQKVNGTGLLQYIPKNADEKVTLNNLNYLMVAKSDNIATNMLIKKIGIENINNRARILNLKSTKLRNYLMLPENKNIQCSLEQCNTTSPRDVAKMLQYLSEDKQLSPEALFMLEHQEDRTGIPNTLSRVLSRPKIPFKVYNKTGTLLHNRYDGAIIQYDGKRYILVVAVSGSINRKAADKIIADITLKICNGYVKPSRIN